MTSRARKVESVEWKCHTCGKRAHFQIGGDTPKHLCGDHWRLTGHAVGIQIEAAKKYSKQGKEEG